MSKTYLAWNGKPYHWPPPEGWYLASDQRWWAPDTGPNPPKPIVETSNTTLQATETGPQPEVDLETALEPNTLFDPPLNPKTAFDPKVQPTIDTPAGSQTQSRLEKLAEAQAKAKLAERAENNVPFEPLTQAEYVTPVVESEPVAESVLFDEPAARHANGAFASKGPADPTVPTDRSSLWPADFDNLISEPSDDDQTEELQTPALQKYACLLYTSPSPRDS